MRSLRGSRPVRRYGLWWCAGLGALLGGSLALAYQFARRVLTPAEQLDARVEVRSIEESADAPTGIRVWLSGPDIDLDGSYSFIFDVTSRATQQLAGHARLGPVIAKERVGRGIRVARNVLSVERGDIRVGTRGRVSGWWYTGPEELGYPSTLVSIPMLGGVSWGWVISPKQPRPGRWAVHVHGRGALPHETLRGVETFAEAGITSLVIAYRNDPGAPPGRGGMYGLGLAEQEDVDAALGWARTQGAEQVTLVGWSMGGTAAVLAAGRGRHADLVDGLVLDSPALDWPGLLRHQAKLAHLHPFIAELGVLMLRAGWIRGAVTGERGTDVSALTPARLAALIRVPTLIHASAGDTFVPWEGSLRVARLKASLVQVHPSRGEHVKLWNVDPVGWKYETARFLRTLHS